MGQPYRYSKKLMQSSTHEQFLTDYRSLTTGCGIVTLEGWTTVSIRGEDRMSFIQNMGTNEISRLGAGDGCELFFTDVKGKIVAHVFSLARKEELLFFTVPQQAATIVNHLDRYIIREDVQLEAKSSNYTWLVVSGAESPHQLKSWTGFDVAQLQAPWQHAECKIQSAEILLVRFAAIGSESFLLRYSSSDKDQLQDLFGNACEASAWNALRVESALPLLGVDFDQTNLPQEVNRNDQAISFTKGCYLGQETIARIDALGHVNQQLVSLRFADVEIPPPGTKLISAEKEVGEITSSCWSPREEAPLALAMVRRGSNTVGSQLESKFGRATVV